MLKRPKILIVDDEIEIRELLAEVISEHYQAILAFNGHNAIEIAHQRMPNLILMDIMMPGMNGIEACRHLRASDATKHIPIVMLTALDEREKKIKAFTAGSDDYIAKPVHPEELLVRIAAKLRRQAEDLSSRSADSSPGHVVTPRYSLNFQKNRLVVNGHAIDFGATEFRIVAALLKKEGELVLRNDLNAEVWEDDATPERSLDPHISALRKKLKATPLELSTIYGKGYSLSVHETKV